MCHDGRAPPRGREGLQDPALCFLSAMGSPPSCVVLACGEGHFSVPGSHAEQVSIKTSLSTCWDLITEGPGHTPGHGLAPRPSRAHKAPVLRTSGAERRLPAATRWQCIPQDPDVVAPPGRMLLPGSHPGGARCAERGPSGGVAQSPALPRTLSGPPPPESRGSCRGFVFTSESYMSEGCIVVA